MKKSFLILSLVCLVSSIGFARRMDTPVSTSGVGIMKHGSTFTLFYKASKPSDVKVSIYDAADKLVFAEVIRKSEGFSRPYNFANLKEGVYTIEVLDQTQRMLEKVNYTQGQVQNLIRVSHVAGSANKYLLTVPAKSRELISVKIFGDRDQLLYDQQESIEGDFAKVYNLDQVQGKLLFSITDSKGNIKEISY